MMSPEPSYYMHISEIKAKIELHSQVDNNPVILGLDQMKPKKGEEPLTEEEVLQRKTNILRRASKHKVDNHVSIFYVYIF